MTDRGKRQNNQRERETAEVENEMQKRRETTDRKYEYLRRKRVQESEEEKKAQGAE